MLHICGLSWLSATHTPFSWCTLQITVSMPCMFIPTAWTTAHRDILCRLKSNKVFLHNVAGTACLSANLGFLLVLKCVKRMNSAQIQHIFIVTMLLTGTNTSQRLTSTISDVVTWWFLAGQWSDRVNAKNEETQHGLLILKINCGNKLNIFL